MIVVTIAAVFEDSLTMLSISESMSPWVEIALQEALMSFVSLSSAPPQVDDVGLRENGVCCIDDCAGAESKEGESFWDCSLVHFSDWSGTQ